MLSLIHVPHVKSRHPLLFPTHCPLASWASLCHLQLFLTEHHCSFFVWASHYSLHTHPSLSHFFLPLLGFSWLFFWTHLFFSAFFSYVSCVFISFSDFLMFTLFFWHISIQFTSVSPLRGKLVVCMKYEPRTRSVWCLHTQTFILYIFTRCLIFFCMYSVLLSWRNNQHTL